MIILYCVKGLTGIIQCANIQSMTKKEAIEPFGTHANLASSLGKCRSAISMWPDELNGDYLNLWVGIAYRMGKPIPDEVLIKTADRPD